MIFIILAFFQRKATKFEYGLRMLKIWFKSVSKMFCRKKLSQIAKNTKFVSLCHRTNT